MTDKAPSMTGELDRSAYEYYTTAMAMAGPTSLNVRRSYTLVTYLNVVCAGRISAQPIYCNDMDLMAPDYRSTMPLQLDETCDLTAGVYEDPTPSHDNSWAITLPQNEVVNHDDANDKDPNPGCQPGESHPSVSQIWCRPAM